MEREEAYDRRAHQTEAGSEGEANSEADLLDPMPPVRYSYRHGDGSAEVLSAQLLNDSRENAELVDSGESLLARMRVRFNTNAVDPVFGFLIRNRLGIHAYGLNTEQSGLKLGVVTRGELIEISFSFDCWLGTD